MVIPYKEYNDLYKIHSKVNIGKELPFFESLFNGSWNVRNYLNAFKGDIVAYGKNLFLEIDSNDSYNTSYYHSDNNLIPEFIDKSISLKKHKTNKFEVLNDVVIFNKTNEWSIKFYHFVFDVLMKLDILINQYKNKTVLISLDFPPQLKNILIQILVNNKINFIEAEEDKKYICNNSIAFNAPTALYARATKEQINFIKSIFVPKKTKTTYKHIYIARKINKDPFSGNPQRSILNEDMLFEELLKNKIDILFPEDFSINEFHYVLKNANTVISSHGSQLTNIIFCNEKTKILEIMPENYFSKSISCFRAISNICNLDYKYILGCTPEKHFYKGPRFKKNIEIPCSNMVLTSEQIAKITSFKKD